MATLRRVPALAILTLALPVLAAWAGPPAGTEIDNQANAQFVESVTSVASTVDSNVVTAVVQQVRVPPTLHYYTDATYTRIAKVTRPGAMLYLKADAIECDTDAGAREVVLLTIQSSVSGDTETEWAREEEIHDGEFYIIAPFQPLDEAAPGEDKENVINTGRDDVLTARLFGCGAEVTETTIMVEPAGVIFDSRTEMPVVGASVTLIDITGASNGGKPGEPAVIWDVDTVTQVSSTVITGGDGMFEFPMVVPGEYRYDVVPPGAYKYPSIVARKDIGKRWHVHGDASYGKSIQINSEVGAALYDLPVDLEQAGTLQIEKTSSRTTAEVGDYVDYSIEIRNVGEAALDNVNINDRLPVGFIYEPRSARLDGASIAEPTGGRGPILDFAIGTVTATDTVTLTYRVRITVAALQGDGINRAQATGGEPLVTSVISAYQIQVRGGVFADDAFVLGKVYADCNANDVQDAGEPGVPDVRIYMEDGSYVISDGAGKYSFAGLSPRTHVLKVDSTTLPAGARLQTLSNRNSGDAGSQFVDLKKGELHRADFAVVGCDAQLEKVINTRGRGLKAGAEIDRNLKTALVADTNAVAMSDPRSLPASGLVYSDSAIQADHQGARRERVQIAAVAMALVALQLPDPVGDQLRFINLHDGEQLTLSQTTVQVQGKAGATFTLTVNDEVVADSQVGTRRVAPKGAMESREYVGVRLQAGENTLVLTESVDGSRTHRFLTVLAPGELAGIAVETSGSTPSGGQQAASLRVLLKDAKGLPVGGRTSVTLESTGGVWQVADLNRDEPGVQIFIEDGSAQIDLLSPLEPGTVRVRANAAGFSAEQDVVFGADLRPMLAVGMIEGVLDLRRLDNRALSPARENDNFERELSGFSRSAGDGSINGGARAALLLKGKVKGSYLLTLGYDSQKDANERLFRDIQPDQFYPVYGDAAVKGYDAQSSGNLYVRIDKDRSYLLYGDYQTQSQALSANDSGRSLSTYNRSLNGVKEHYEQGNLRANVFASRDSTRQIVDELRGNGTSGPYALSVNDGLVNSEKVQIITRDRNQPTVVLSVIEQTRFLDYEIEPFTGRLLMRAPVHSVDEDLNPVFIRITYEAATSGREFWVAGGDAQLRISERVELGVSAADDADPTDSSSQLGASVRVRLAEKTVLTGEFAYTDRDSIGSGDGGRIELHHETAKLQVEAYAGRTDSQFSNPSASLGAGREEGSVRANYRVDDRNRIVVEGIHTAAVQNQSQIEGVLAGVEHSFASNNTKLELGSRYVVTDAADGSDTDTTSVRAKVSSDLPYLNRTNVYGEYEQNVSDRDEQLAAVGGEYRLGNRGRIYVRHEFISSLSGPYDLDGSQEQNSTIIGLDADYMKDGRTYSEYRVRDSISGREAQAAVGLRNSWTMAEGMHLDAGFERVFAGSSDNESAALTSAIEYTRNPLWKGTARLELRTSPTSDGLLNTLGLARKVTDEWTVLAKSILSLTDNDGATGDRLQARVQFGVAYRDLVTNEWTGLTRYEFKREEDKSVAAPMQRQAHILSAHANYQPNSVAVYSFRYAVKHGSDHSNGLRSSGTAQLLSARSTWDITEQWDVGLIVSGVIDGSSGQQYGVGAELGRQVKGNLWVSVGYNVFGYEEKDLAGEDYTDAGAYLRLRFKFDETLLGKLGVN